MLAYEDLTLRSSLEELIALAAARGWRQNARPVPEADQIVTVFTTPDHPVKRYKLGYERGRLVNIIITYRRPDPARTALRAGFPVSRHVEGAWYLTDEARTVLASVDDAGQTVRALHLASLRDQGEAAALLRSALGDPPRRS